MLLAFPHEAIGQERQISTGNSTVEFNTPSGTDGINPTNPDLCNPDDIIFRLFCLQLGPNEVQVQGTSGAIEEEAKFFRYSIEELPNIDPVIAESRRGNVTVTATSMIVPLEEKTNKDRGGNSTYFPWELRTSTNIERNGSQTSGKATARATDPLPFAVDDINSGLSSLFEETVTFMSGLNSDEEPSTSIFRMVEFDDIFTTTFRDTTLLKDDSNTEEREDRIFDITISATTLYVPDEEFPIPGGIDAEVFINPHSSLTFFEDSDLTIEIAAEDLENLLEMMFEDDENGLGTPDGLNEEISFSYRWDLSGFEIGPEDTIGGGGESFAGVPIPEPSTNVSLLLFGGLGAVLIGKRQLKSHKSPKK